MADLNNKVQEFRRQFNITESFDQVFKLDPNGNLRVIACNSGTQMRVRDSSATRIFFKKNRMMQHQAQKITPKF